MTFGHPITSPGSTIWCALFGAIGWAVGRSYHRFNHALDLASILVVVSIIVGACVWILWRRRSR